MGGLTDANSKRMRPTWRMRAPLSIGGGALLALLILLFTTDIGANAIDALLSRAEPGREIPAEVGIRADE